MSIQSEIDVRIAKLLAEKNEQAILDLLRKGVIKPDQIFVIGGTRMQLLTVAAAENYNALALYLIANGADINRPFYGRTPLMDACEWQNHELLDALLIAKADTRVRQKAGEGEADDTPLMMSAERCDLFAVQRLLAAGADAKAMNRDGQTVLHSVLRAYATRPERHPNARELLEHLLQAGVPLVGTELHLAVHQRDVEMVTLLLGCCGPVNMPYPRNERSGPTKGDTPLITACRFNNVDMMGGHFGFEVTDDARIELVRRLLEGGADPNLPGAKGMTPLRVLVPRVVGDFHLRLAEILVDAGADPYQSSVGAKDQSAASLATKLGVSDFMELFARVPRPNSQA